MYSVFSIFYNCTSTFDYLDGKFDDQLNRISNLIFFIYGVLTPISISFPERTVLTTSDPFIISILHILPHIIGGLLAVFTYKLLITNVVYALGRALKGASDRVDVQTVIAYSMIPLILENLMKIGFDLIALSAEWIYWTISLIAVALSARIAILGLDKFNRYGLTRSLMNYAPILIIVAIKIFFYLLF